MDRIGFLDTPPGSAEADAIFEQDEADHGYVMNVSRLWAYQPGTMKALFALMRQTIVDAGLTQRDLGILVAATASSRGDSYCSLAWGSRLSEAATPAVAAAVLLEDGVGLADGEREMAAWARKVVRDPNAVTELDVQRLRDVGFDDARIFAITNFVSLRLAFSTLNDALGALPDAELHHGAPSEVAAAIRYGRPPASS